MAAVLDPTTVHSVLDVACYGQNLRAQQDAMRRLQEFEAFDGFTASLLQIIQSPTEVKSDIRLLAIISLKNLVGRNWIARSRPVRVLSVEEKYQLKEFAIKYLCDPEKKIALQITALAGKISRIDWPTDWPDLFPVLIAAVQNVENWILQRRAMFTLQEVLKSLTEKTLPQTRRAFTEALIALFPIISTLWAQMCQSLSEHLVAIKGSDTVAVVDESFAARLLYVEQLLNHLCVTTRVLKKILERAYSTISTIDALPGFYTIFVGFMTTFSQFLRESRVLPKPALSLGDQDSGYDDDESSREDDDDDDIFTGESSRVSVGEVSGGAVLGSKIVVPLLRRVVKDMASTVTKIQEDYPIEIVPFLGAFLEFFQAQLTIEFTPPATAPAGSTVQPYQQSFCISAILFISNTIACSSYSAEGMSSSRTMQLARQLANSSTIGADAAVEIQVAASVQGDGVRRRFFDDERVASLLTLCLQYLLRYSPTELEQWENDPENFFLAQQSLNESDTIKSAAEGLYLGLLDVNEELVGRQIAALLSDVPRQIAAVQPGAAEAEVVLWDAVYLAAGLAPATLGKFVNGNEWVAGALGPLLHNMVASPAAGTLRGGQQLLRARLLWLLSCWSYRLEAPLLSEVLSLVVLFLENAATSDCVAVLHAVAALQPITNTDAFSPDILAPVLLRLTQALCTIASQRVTESDSRSAVVTAIGELMSLMGRNKLGPILTPLAQHMGGMWAACPVDSPLRTHIIEATTRIARAAGNDSESLHAIALPLVAYATSGADESSFLAKEGVLLWQAVARNIPPGRYSPDLDALFKRSVPALLTHRLVGSEVEDLKDFVLIAEAYAVSGGLPFLVSCAAALHQLFASFLGQVSPRAVPYLIRPIEALFLSCPLETSQFLVQSDILAAILKPCAAEIPSLATVFAESKESDVALVSYLSIVARMCLTSLTGLRDGISRFIALHAASLGVSPETLPGATDTMLKGLLRLLIDKFDAVGYSSSGIWRRRLFAVALLMLYPTTDGDLIQWLPEIFNLVVDVMSEEAADEGRGRAERLVNSVLTIDDESPLWDEDGDGVVAVEQEPISSAFSQLLHADLVVNSSLLEISRQKLSALQPVLGAEMFSQLMHAAGEKTMQHFV